MTSFSGVGYAATQCIINNSPFFLILGLFCSITLTAFLISFLSPNPVDKIRGLFVKAALEGNAPYINGDGSFSRDFTYVANAVEANIKAIFTKDDKAINQIYNIALGRRTTLNELWDSISREVHINIKAIHRENRQGDVPHSLANIDKAKLLLKYDPQFDVEKGLKEAIKWYKNKFISNINV